MHTVMRFLFESLSSRIQTHGAESITVDSGCNYCCTAVDLDIRTEERHIYVQLLVNSIPHFATYVTQKSPGTPHLILRHLA